MDPKKEGCYLEVYGHGCWMRCWIRRDQVAYIRENEIGDATIIGLVSGKQFRVNQKMDEVHRLVFNGSEPE